MFPHLGEARPKWTFVAAALTTSVTSTALLVDRGQQRIPVWVRQVLVASAALAWGVHAVGIAERRISRQVQDLADQVGDADAHYARGFVDGAAGRRPDDGQGQGKVVPFRPA